MTQTQYVLPILMGSSDTWSRIHMLVQPLSCLYDQHGNLKDCAFSRRKDEWVGEFCLFQSLDRTVAETVRDTIKQNSTLTLLPINTVQYQQPSP